MISILPFYTSNHASIFIRLHGMCEPFSQRPFRFLPAWLRDKDCDWEIMIVKEIFKTLGFIFNQRHKIFMQKLKILSLDFFSWNKDHFNHIQGKLKILNV